MTAMGNDRWQARFVPDRLGRWEYTVHGWIDQFGSWNHGIRAEAFDGQDVTVEFEVGRRLLAAIQADDDDRRVMAAAADALSRGDPLLVVANADHHNGAHETHPVDSHGQYQSILITVPPLGVTVRAPERW